MTRHVASATLLLCVLAGSTALGGLAERSDWSPWVYEAAPLTARLQTSPTVVGPELLLAEYLLTGYQRFLSSGSGMDCPMYPSCSRYARAAIRDRGTLVGVTMTLDRLCRCGNDLRFYDLVHVDGGLRRYDPPVRTRTNAGYSSSSRVDESDSGDGPIFGQQPDDSPPTCGEQLRFAESLLDEGDCYRAVGEYKRVLYLCNDGATRTKADLGIGRALLEAGRYQSVLEWSEQSSEFRDEAAVSVIAGHAMFRLEDYERAIPVLAEARLGTSHSMPPGRAQYLEGLCNVRLERWEEGRTAFSNVEAGSPHYDMAQRHRERLAETPSYPTRAPTTAGILAAVPGVGYAYTGHARTALAAFIVSGALGWAAADAFRDEQTATGISLAGLAAGFYVANIVGSIESARRHNEWQYERVQAGFPE